LPCFENMNSAHNKSILIFLLSSIGLIAFPHINHIPKVLSAFFYLLLSWRFIGIWKQNWLPGKLMIFFLTVCGVALIYSQHQGIFGRDAGTRLFVTALALKLLEIKSERDLYLITYLAFIVAASQFLYEQSLLMAAYILFVCCVLLATLVCINSGKPQPGAALKTASIILVQAIPIAVVLFILFPRVEAPKWMLFNEKHQAKAGLSDNMEPGSISDLGLSDELVFRVKFTGALPPPGQRYWRGPVLSHTDGKRWTQVKDLRYIHNIDKPVFTGSAYQYTLLMEPQDKNWVFALEMAADYALPLSQNANYQLITSENPDKRAEYKITSYPNYNTGYITRAEYKDATQLPGEPSGKIKQLVKQLHGFDSSPNEFINHLLSHFRKENFHYTLTPPLMEENPIETFLFATRYGFCSHYAAAFVYLMRVAQIPARVVTGYQGGELNKAGNFLEIRQADAHAWAEVWIENKGWVRFDPTAAIAPERIERNIDIDQLIPGGLISYMPTSAAAQAAFNWLKQTRQLWSNIDYNWQRWVINYDNKNQSRFLSSLGITDIKDMIYWMVGGIGLITALLSWLLLYQKQKAIPPVLRIYNRFCQKIAKRGLLRGQCEGAKDFAGRVKIKLPEQAANIDQITALFIKLRYGRNATPDDLKLFNKLVARFKV
jgi:transglutaminase-like putative cysteine protease